MRHVRRKKISLVLAYAITKHKSQGMTLLDDVYLDYEGAFDPGQLAVVISRVRDMKEGHCCPSSHTHTYPPPPPHTWFVLFGHVVTLTQNE